MNILVTGANGQLGSELRELSAHCTHRFFFTDVQELDITFPEAVQGFVRDHAIDVLVNCAAYTAVDRAEEQHDLAHRLNAEAPGMLARVMHEAGGTMLHVSTDYVFDGTAHTPYREEDAPCPASVYGSTKLEGERAVRKNCPASIVLRTAWLYSSYGANFVKTMLRLGRERTELGVVADQVGTPTYARDLAEAILHILERGAVPGIYHFTDEGVASWYDFACEVHRLAGITSCRVRPIRTEEYPVPAARPHYSVLDKSKIKETFQLTLPWWKDSLRACMERIMEQ